MRNSLFYKLMGAFMMVVLVGALVISVLLVGSTRSAFVRYSSRNGQVLATRLADRLADFYSLNGSWDGVGDYLALDQWSSTSANKGMMTRMGRMMSGVGIIAAMNLRIILADENATIIADSRGEDIGRNLSSAELNDGVPVMVNGLRVGTVVTVSEGLGSLVAREFLASINIALVKSILVAGVIALLLGFILFNQITAPLRKMQKAANQISQGDLNTRVKVDSSDELGDLAYSFNEMAENLSQAENQRRQMAADVAHELRTPLAAIQATLEGMQDGILPPNQEQIGTLVAETALLNRMVDDLRLLSLAEAGRLKMNFQPVGPAGLIQRVVDSMTPLASQQGVELVPEADKDLPQIRADADRVIQILNNLVHNALRYTSAGGHVTIGAIYESREKVVLFSVTDTGRGIPAEDLPHVFDRFYRAEKSRSRVSGGSGLGLAIVKQLVEAHGGTVTAESPVLIPEGRSIPGTRITFSIPVLD